MLISKEEFNNQKALEIYQAAFIDAKMDDDGDVLVQVDDLRLSARVLKDRPFFVVSGIWAVKDEATREQLLEFANRFNDGMIMVRCTIPKTKKPAVYFDHFTMVEGGITAQEVVRVTQRFAKVIRDGIRSCDTDDIID